MQPAVPYVTPCHRCQRTIPADDTLYARVERGVNGRGEPRVAHCYHLQCLPPNLFHQSAGSRPASRVAPG